MLAKYEICEYFNKCQAWLSTSWGKARIKQCISMTGGATLEHFIDYQTMQLELITEVKNCLTYKEIALVLYDGNKSKHKYQKGWLFIDRLTNRIYDDDYFLKVVTIEKLRKLQRSIKDIE